MANNAAYLMKLPFVPGTYNSETCDTYTVIYSATTKGSYGIVSSTNN